MLYPILEPVDVVLSGPGGPLRIWRRRCGQRARHLGHGGCRLTAVTEPRIQ